jgi:hypothetical protein
MSTEQNGEGRTLSALLFDTISEAVICHIVVFGLLRYIVYIANGAGMRHTRDLRTL